MQFQEIVQLLTQTSVTIVVIAYFMIRDWKFQDTLNKTLQTLVDTVTQLKTMIEGDKK